MMKKILGLYILHPNNVGRCGHICNASYTVSSKSRGLHIGEKLVKDCILKAYDNGYKVLQFNACLLYTSVHGLWKIICLLRLKLMIGLVFWCKPVL